MSLISEVVVDYLLAQIAAGAQVVQLFDSWVGWLGPYDYELLVLPHVRYVIDKVKGRGAPVIYFGNGASAMLHHVGQGRQRGHRRGLAHRSRPRLGRSSDGVAIQGNLDPHHAARPAQGHRGARRRHHRAAPAAAPATSSTWVTASSRRPRPTTSSTWSTRCTACPPRPSERRADGMTESLVDVALLAYGGPREPRADPRLSASA